MAGDDTHEGPCSVGDLPPWDQLLHGIGRVTQAQVRCEVYLRMTHQLLELWGATTQPPKRTDNLSRLVNKVAGQLSDCTAAEWLREAGEVALQDARAADKRRHRVVDDWWRHKVGDAAFSGSQATDLPGVFAGHEGDLAFVDDVEAELARVEHQLNALYMALGVALTRGEFQTDLADRAQAEPVIRGRIDLRPGGGYRVRVIP